MYVEDIGDYVQEIICIVNYDKQCTYCQYYDYLVRKLKFIN